MRSIARPSSRWRRKAASRATWPSRSTTSTSSATSNSKSPSPSSGRSSLRRLTSRTGTNSFKNTKRMAKDGPFNLSRNSTMTNPFSLMTDSSEFSSHKWTLTTRAQLKRRSCFISSQTSNNSITSLSLIRSDRRWRKRASTCSTTLKRWTQGLASCSATLQNSWKYCRVSELSYRRTT